MGFDAERAKVAISAVSLEHLANSLRYVAAYLWESEHHFAHQARAEIERCMCNEDEPVMRLDIEEVGVLARHQGEAAGVLLQALV